MLVDGVAVSINTPATFKVAGLLVTPLIEAVIVVVPPALPVVPVARPEEEIVATALLLLAQFNNGVTFIVKPSAKVPIAVYCCVFCESILALTGVIAIDTGKV